MRQYRNQRLYTFFERQVLSQSPNSNTELRRIIFPSLSTVYGCKSLDTEAYVSDVCICDFRTRTHIIHSSFMDVNRTFVGVCDAIDRTK